MPFIDPAALSPELALYARILERDGTPCDYLHYGLAGASGTDTPTCRALQENFSEILEQSLKQNLPPDPQAGSGSGPRLLLWGPSLGRLARDFAQRQLGVTWVSPAAPAGFEDSAPETLSLLRAGPPQPESFAPCDCILLEGSFPFPAQLGLLSQCRRLLGQRGRLLLFGEFLDDDSAIARSPLPNLSSLRQLAERLGYRLRGEQDYSAGAIQSLQVFQQAVATHGGALIAAGACAEEELTALRHRLQQMLEEFSTGRRCFRLFELDRQADSAGEYAAAEFGDIHSFAPAEIAGLFEKSFDTPFNADLWRWKYELGQGRCVVAREHPGGDIVSHYGGAPRHIRYFGAESMAIQVCDVMVLPEERRHYGKSSLFFKTAATFLEREIGNTVDHLLGFGFPNQKAMNIAIRLGLYEKTDDFLEVVYAEPGANSPPWQAAPLNLSDPAMEQTVDGLWRRMYPDFEQAIIGLRDGDYIKYRYFDHPFAAEGLYRPLLLEERDGGQARALAFLKRHGEQWLLMDLVCPLADMEPALDCLRHYVREQEPATRLKLWITRAWLERVSFAVAAVNELGIEIPCNSWNPGPSAETLYGAWWLTAGDMDFM